MLHVSVFIHGQILIHIAFTIVDFTTENRGKAHASVFYYFPRGVH